MVKELIYQRRNLESFAILGKGSSLRFIKDYYMHFESCYVLSDFDEELYLYEIYFKNKKIIHFANRESLSMMRRSTYNNFKINYIQLSTKLNINDLKILKTYLLYKIKNPRLKVFFLDNWALAYNKNFSKEYKNKFPNTGILSILYAIDYISPRNLWIFGIDFYTSPYSIKQKNPSPLQLNEQNNKIQRLNLIQILHEKIIQSPHIKFHIISNYSDWPDLPNVKKYI